MPYSTICKLCKKMNEPLLDKIESKVYCGNCDEEIPEASKNHFVKVQLDSLKQLKSVGSYQKSYSVSCHKCKKLDRPILKDNIGFCAHCKTQLNLTIPFILTLQDYLKTSKDD